MPLFDFKCSECSFKKEHFVANGSKRVIKCPKCGSEKYSRLLPEFSVNVEYRTMQEINEKKIDPFVKEMHEKIGREATDFDTKTLNNLFGEDKVKSTFYEQDD
jgi:putative FmdB family regulatory protein